MKYCDFEFWTKQHVDEEKNEESEVIAWNHLNDSKRLNKEILCNKFKDLNNLQAFPEEYKQALKMFAFFIFNFLCFFYKTIILLMFVCLFVCFCGFVHRKQDACINYIKERFQERLESRDRMLFSHVNDIYVFFCVFVFCFTNLFFYKLKCEIRTIGYGSFRSKYH